MKNELFEILADIDSSTHEAKLDTFNSIFVNEMKEDAIEDLESNVYTESMLTAGSIPENKSYKDYDFKTHDTTQGSHNRQFAHSLQTLYLMTRTTHGDNKHKKAGTEYIPRGFANERKYQMALMLLKEFSSLKPNFAKITYVSENIGSYTKRNEQFKSPVLYIELTLPDGEYMMCIHIPRPAGTESAKTAKHVKQTQKKRLNAIIELEKFNSPDITKLGNNDKTKYDEIENRYKSFKINKKTGDSMFKALKETFDLNGGD